MTEAERELVQVLRDVLAEIEASKKRRLEGEQTIVSLSESAVVARAQRILEKLEVYSR